MTFLELVQKTLEAIGKPLSADEIWEKAQELGIAQQLSTTGKTPIATLSARIYVDMRDNPSSILCIMSKRPTRFGFKKWMSTPQVTEPQATEDVRNAPDKVAAKYRERDLHPVLTYFAYYFMKTLLKTINDKISKGRPKGKSEWMHPDMVGLDISSIKEFDKGVLKFSNQINQTPITVYSFEIKKYLDFSNLRESYFQAVSNSKWANKGYLVCAEINQNDSDLMDELRRLSTAYGIGLIKLDLANPDESKILFESSFNEVMDWDFINYLFGLNDDYKTFIQASVDVLKTEEVYKERFDEVMSQEKIVEYVRQLG